jgi:hypothetical protein
MDRMPDYSSRIGFFVWLALLTGSAIAKDESAATDLSVLGVPNGSVEVRAGTEDVSIALTVESIATAAMTVIIRPTPFLDANNQPYTAHIKQSDGTRVPELSTQIPAAGTTPVEVVAKLGPEGKYIGQLLLLVGSTRSSVKMTVTRALEDADVEILGLEQVTGSASDPSSATLRLTLAEKSSRALTLHSPVLIEYARKEGNARSDTAFKIASVDPSADSIPLAAGESQEITVNLAGFEGAGEYIGKIRFASTGFKNADAPFTVILRESAWIAFWMIFFGVILSVLLRWLTQRVRPRLLERRRVYRLILLLDALKREPAREMEEAELLDAMRAEGVAWAAELEGGKIADVKAAVDLIEARRKLFVEWVPWRRRVRKLTPPELSEKFWPTIEQVAEAIRTQSTKEAIDGAVTKLRELRAIDTALGEILTTRIQELEAGVKSALARPSAKLTSEAQGQLLPMLEDANRRLRQKNLQGALETYSRARELWASLLFSDLAEVLQTELPLSVDQESKKLLIDPLVDVAKQAEELVKTDPDYAIRQYNVILNRYVAGLCELLLASCVKVGDEIDQADGGALTGVKAEDLRTSLGAARDKVAVIRDKNLKGDRQAALTEIWEQFRAVAKIRNQAVSRTRGRQFAPLNNAIDSTAPAFLNPQSIPGGLSDPERSNLSLAPQERPITEGAVSLFTRLANAIDLFSTAVAIIMASVLGITTIWANDATWGGWQDYLVCLLWGLGLHQFTFTGVNNLRDRISGNEATGNTQ